MKYVSMVKIHDKKTKGDIGVANIICALIEQGWNVSLPISEHTRYDLIVEKDNICKTVQVRYTTIKKNVILVKLRSTWADKNGSHARTREIRDYDVLAIFGPLTKTSIFISDKELGNLGTAVSFRFNIPKNNNKKPFRLVKDYLMLL